MIRIADIAAGLRVPRWTFQTALPLSVLQHSVFVSRQVTQAAAPYALLHDAHEAYLGDHSSPVKAAIVALIARAGLDLDPVKMLEDRFDRAIFHRFGLAWPMPAHIATAVKFADLQALATEKRDLVSFFAKATQDRADLSSVASAQDGLPPPLPETIRPMPWPKAQDQFMERFCALFPGYTE